MRIYVGNLSYRSSEQDVHKAFTVFGEVTRTELAIDPQTGRSAGFAYVEMPNEEEAQTAIARLNGKEINARVVAVSQAVAEEPAVRQERFPQRPERPGRFARDAGGSRGHAPRQVRGESASAGRERSERRAGSGPAARRPPSPRGNQFRGEPSRGGQSRGEQRRGEPSRGEQSRGEQRRGSGRSASVWEQRNRTQPAPAAQRRDSEWRAPARDSSPGQTSGEAPGAEQPANPAESPAADNPWTRRRRQSP